MERRFERNGSSAFQFRSGPAIPHGIFPFTNEKLRETLFGS
jgi:hypothetical protein